MPPPKWIPAKKAERTGRQLLHKKKSLFCVGAQLAKMAVASCAPSSLQANAKPSRRSVAEPKSSKVGLLLENCLKPPSPRRGHPNPSSPRLPS